MSRTSPTLCAIDVADASLIAVRELVIAGDLKTNSTDLTKHIYEAGSQFSRKSTESLLNSVRQRALQILTYRFSPEFWARFGENLHKGWANVTLREVIYALSTAHPQCLRAFRVFKGHTIEWVGDDSHRPKPDSATKSKTTKPPADGSSAATAIDLTDQHEDQLPHSLTPPTDELIMELDRSVRELIIERSKISCAALREERTGATENPSHPEVGSRV